MKNRPNDTIMAKPDAAPEAAPTHPHDFYFCYLPQRMGRLSALLLRLFYSGITIEPEQLGKLKELPSNAIRIYANKYQSKFEYLFYHTRYQKEKITLPEIGFEYRMIFWQRWTRLLKIVSVHCAYFLRHRKLLDPYESKFITRKLTNGKGAFLSLVGKKSFYRRFVKTKTDPIAYLIEIQTRSPRPIYIIPQLMFFSRKPDKSPLSLLDIFFGTESKPGNLRRIVKLFKNPGRVFVEVSDPLNLKEFLLWPSNQGRGTRELASNLRERLIQQLNRHRQSITGPVIKTPQELKQNILTNERLRMFMEKYSRNRQMPLRKVHKKADEHINEIAARYSTALVSVADRVLRWLFKAMFDGVSVDTRGLKLTKNLAQRGPLVFIPSHKSHIDYLVLAFVLYHNNVPLPLIAAGKNLAFWPMGPIFRHAGAFFIRRSFKGAVLYAKVFSEYIHKLLEEGFNLELFIEGGRSRTGKLLLPKLGLLSILLNAYKNGACDDLIFVPVFIGYDQVLEENAYLHELEGGEKKPENFRQVFRARKFLKKRYGRIYIKFHAPIVLNRMLREYDTTLPQMKHRDFIRFSRDLGFRITNAIDRVSVVTPHALVAAALLNTPKERISHVKLLSVIDTYMDYLLSQRVTLADTLVIDPGGTVDQVIEAYLQRNFIDRVAPAKGDEHAEAHYTVNANKRPSLEYYKNNAVIFFVPPAITALAILENDAFQFSASDLHASYRTLRDFFKNEFAFNMDHAPEYVVRKCLKAFIDDAILMPHPTLPDTYNLTSVGFRKLKRFAAFLKTYFESYWVVLNVLSLYPKKSLGAKRTLRKSESRGNRMYKRKEISHKEALSKVNYANALGLFTSKGISGSEDTGQIAVYSQILRHYIDLLT